MVLSSKNSALFSDVFRVFYAHNLPQFPPKYRTRCSRRFPSGRLSRRGRIRAIKSLQASAYIYKTMSGRSGWPSRDPIGEKGGMNLYGLIGNDPNDKYDVLGLFDTGSQGRTDAVKNSDLIRGEVSIMVHNMLSSRIKVCTKGKAIERKSFHRASSTPVVSMYLTGYFLLGQVAVPLKGSGYYEVNCCAKEFGKWEIMINGSFHDHFDELIPSFGLTDKKGYLSTPMWFAGEWVEFYSGSE